MATEARPSAARPTGTVTFLFSDVEGSTERWERDREAMATAMVIDSASHPELLVCNWFNEIGTLLKHRLVAEAPFMDLFARLIVHCWAHLASAVAIMRRTRGDSQYHDFEYLAARAALWVDRHPRGTLPRTFTRESLPDRWLETDRKREPGSPVVT